MAYFQTKYPDLGKFLECLAMEDVGILYGTLVYYTAIWYRLWPFGIVCGHLVSFVAIWYRLWPFGIVCGHFEYFIVN
jgi:ABC-type spermidine/putrescine transport system permease subunit II